MKRSDSKNNPKFSEFWADDLLAGFVVFLIALPLSIGIALAAGAPASSGILSAIIGGIVGTLFTGTHISISGPAAGLIVVVGGSILSLADGGDLYLGFQRTLAATIVAGILQVFIGVFRLGKLTFLAPSAVVQGMLAAIGAIIMIKQLPILLGVENMASSILGVLYEMPSMITLLNLPILTISLLGLAILILWRYLPTPVTKVLPSALVVVAAGLGLSYYFDIEHPHNIHWLKFNYHLGPEYLVHVPSSLKELIIFPKFDIVFSGRSLASVATLFLVGSLETLLSAYAVDKLDPYKRITDMDFDIIGKGITNITCGLLGAYPIITEIVRSSANISNGAKTKWSNFFHGVFILFFVGLFPTIINHIPLSSLAAILFMIGFNLAHPKKLLDFYHHGKEQLLYFGVTLFVTLAGDLLMGVAAGVIVKIFHHVFIKRIKLKDFFSPKIKLEQADDKSILKIQGPVVFLGYLKLEKVLRNIDKSKPIEIMENNHYLDYSTRETLKDFISDRNN